MLKNNLGGSNNLHNLSTPPRMSRQPMYSTAISSSSSLWAMAAARSNEGIPCLKFIEYVDRPDAKLQFPLKDRHNRSGEDNGQIINIARIVASESESYDGLLNNVNTLLGDFIKSQERQEKVGAKIYHDMNKIFSLYEDRIGKISQTRKAINKLKEGVDYEKVGHFSIRSSQELDAAVITIRESGVFNSTSLKAAGAAAGNAEGLRTSFPAFLSGSLRRSSDVYSSIGSNEEPTRPLLFRVMNEEILFAVSGVFDELDQLLKKTIKSDINAVVSFEQKLRKLQDNQRAFSAESTVVGKLEAKMASLAEDEPEERVIVSVEKEIEVLDFQYDNQEIKRENDLLFEIIKGIYPKKSFDPKPVVKLNTKAAASVYSDELVKSPQGKMTAEAIKPSPSIVSVLFSPEKGADGLTSRIEKILQERADLLESIKRRILQYQNTSNLEAKDFSREDLERDNEVLKECIGISISEIEAIIEGFELKREKEILEKGVTKETSSIKEKDIAKRRGELKQNEVILSFINSRRPGETCFDLMAEDQKMVAPVGVAVKQKTLFGILRSYLATEGRNIPQEMEETKRDISEARQRINAVGELLLKSGGVGENLSEGLSLLENMDNDNTTEAEEVSKNTLGGGQKAERIFAWYKLNQSRGGLVYNFRTNSRPDTAHGSSQKDHVTAYVALVISFINSIPPIARTENMVGNLLSSLKQALAPDQEIGKKIAKEIEQDLYDSDRRSLIESLKNHPEVVNKSDVDLIDDLMKINNLRDVGQKSCDIANEFITKINATKNGSLKRADASSDTGYARPSDEGTSIEYIAKLNAISSNVQCLRELNGKLELLEQEAKSNMSQDLTVKIQNITNLRDHAQENLQEVLSGKPLLDEVDVNTSGIKVKNDEVLLNKFTQHFFNIFDLDFDALDGQMRKDMKLVGKEKQTKAINAGVISLIKRHARIVGVVVGGFIEEIKTTNPDFINMVVDGFLDRSCAQTSINNIIAPQREGLKGELTTIFEERSVNIAKLYLDKKDKSALRATSADMVTPPRTPTNSPPATPPSTPPHSTRGAGWPPMAPIKGKRSQEYRKADPGFFAPIQSQSPNRSGVSDRRDSQLSGISLVASSQTEIPSQSPASNGENKGRGATLKSESNEKSPS